MSVVAPIAARAGYQPDAILCAEDAPQGRPAPWLIFECAKRLNVYPMHRIVKVDDTVVGVEAGINAGAWSVGVAMTGNMMGLSKAELEALSVEERQSRVQQAREKLLGAGADVVMDGIDQLPAIIESINQGALSRKSAAAAP